MLFSSFSLTLHQAVLEELTAWAAHDAVHCSCHTESSSLSNLTGNVQGMSPEEINDYMEKHSAMQPAL